MSIKFSRLSCPLFLVTAVILYYMKTNRILQVLLVCVGILSCMHHGRTLSNNKLDCLRCFDILFANILGLFILITLGPWSLVYLIPAVILFIISKNQSLSFQLRNFCHMLLHIIVCVGIIIQSYIKYKKST